MKKIVLFFLALFSATLMYAQPSFALVGFGAGTTGGQGGTTVTVSDYAGLSANVTGTDAKIIQVSGTITGPSGGQILDVGSNKTIIGLGCNAKLSMIQLHLKNSNNIIIQNIIFSMVGSTLGSDADMICMETTSTNECSKIWIDHCEFYM
jgi:pectate lyase